MAQPDHEMTRIPSPETDPEHFPSGPLEYEGGSAIEQAIARGDTDTAEQWFKEQSEKSHPHE
jgi:hypothetical protein